jgi:hypothetical protein
MAGVIELDFEYSDLDLLERSPLCSSGLKISLVH